MRTSPSAEHWLPSVLVVDPESRGDGALASRVGTVADRFRLTHALSLSSALGALATHSFDAVLVDLALPEVAAVEVARALRARTGDAVLVVALDYPAPAGIDGLADLVLDPGSPSDRWIPALDRLLEVSGLRTALRAMEASAARLSSIVDCVGDAVFTTDTEGLVTSWNAGAGVLLGYPGAEVVGREATVLFPPGSAEAGRMLERVLAGEAVRGIDTVLRTREGLMVEVSIDAAPLRDDSGTVTGVVVVGRDVGDRRELEAELVRQTMHDVLTGLPNRAFLTYRLTQALAAARRRESQVAVLMIDLDQFKAVDDIHGHLVGDKVLAAVADRLRTLARPSDVVGRAGGDEFVLVCPDTDLAEADRLAGRVLEVIAEPIQVEQRVVRIGASVGIAVAPPLDDDAQTLLKHADAAVYEAKARGRARSQVFDHEFAREAATRRRVAADLQAALARNRLEVHYQPVYDLTTERIVGLEALARWRHPLHGVVSPGTFIPLAEAHGFIGELDRWVVDRACHDVVGALVSGAIPATTRVAVNLSARSLDDPDLVTTVADSLRRSGLPPESLALEVTETAVLENRDAARASLEGLRALGTSVFLDDFGTGYSSLSFLRELPVTGVKIDRSFVRGALEGPQDIAIADAIIRLAHGLGLETIAEGIETEEQRDLVRRLGCASAQGFLWSAAVPVTELGDDRAAARVARIRQEPPARFAAAPRRWSALSRRRPEQTLAKRHRAVCCLRGGLEAGQAWLVIAGPVRREEFARALGPLRITSLTQGQLLELDAYDTLRRVAGPDGGLEDGRFARVVGEALRRLDESGAEVGVHAELGHVNQPLSGVRVAAELRTRLLEVSGLGLEYADHPADCAQHGPPLAAASRHLASGSSSA